MCLTNIRKHCWTKRPSSTETEESLFSLCLTASSHLPFFFFLNEPAPTEIYPLPLHDALPTSPARTARGIALVSWYGDESGSRTASGEHFDPGGLTFAHRTIRFGTRVRFCHAGRCVVAHCTRSEEHTSELQSQSNLVCRLLLEK